MYGWRPCFCSSGNFFCMRLGLVGDLAAGVEQRKIVHEVHTGEAFMMRNYLNFIMRTLQDFSLLNGLTSAMILDCLKRSNVTISLQSFSQVSCLPIFSKQKKYCMHIQSCFLFWTSPCKIDKASLKYGMPSTIHDCLSIISWTYQCATVHSRSNAILASFSVCQMAA